jgi:hypothetical protein
LASRSSCTIVVIEMLGTVAESTLGVVLVAIDVEAERHCGAVLTVLWSALCW